MQVEFFECQQVAIVLKFDILLTLVFKSQLQGPKL